MNTRFSLQILIIILITFVLIIKECFSQSTSFDKQLVSSNFVDGTEVFACDINDDGLTDFATTGNSWGGQLVWWENDGYLGFIKHEVDNNLDWARSVCAGDLNEDGTIDLVCAAWGGSMIRWYENNGNENFTMHYVDNDFTGAHTVDIKDVNDDGRPDVLCSGFDNTSAFSEIAWWENMPDTTWTKHVISARFQQSPFIFGEDIDHDGDMDILACGELNGEVYWWENDGSQGWTEHMISDNFPMAHTVFARDIDLDGDFDIIGAACMSSSLAWWENDGSQNFTKHPMGSLAGALWFDAVDLDNDGDRDLYAGGQGASQLVWWENDGSSNFTRHNFDDPFTQTFSVVHADFDNDSDTDLVAVGFSSDQIAWFSNNLVVPNLYDKPECVVYDNIYDRYIVANIGNGSLVETDTANNTSYWVHGYGILYGMCISEGILYTSDGDTLFGFHLANGNEVMALRIINYNNLDGMTTDGNGNLYVIDTWGRLLKVDLEAQTYSELVNQGLPAFPQDCVFDPFHNRIVVAAYEASAPIVAVDPATGEITTLTTNSVGRYDGITIDQYGNFYLASHVGGGRVYKYLSDFSNDPIIVAYGLGEPTGLNYNQQDDILAVPSFNKDTVYFIPVIATGMTEPVLHPSLHFNIYPNPSYGNTRISIESNMPDDLYFRVYSTDGGLVHATHVSTSEDNMQVMDLSGLSAGTYVVKLSNTTSSATQKLVIR